MFSEILKTISLENVPKCQVGVGRLSFAANERLPNPNPHFGTFPKEIVFRISLNMIVSPFKN